MSVDRGELVTVAEAAEAMALKTSTIRKWLYERRIPYIRLGKRAVRIPKSWIREQIHTGWHDPIKETGV